MTPLPQNKREELHKYVDSLNGRCLTSRVPVPKIAVRKRIDELVETELEKQREELNRNISTLRQWLNENRITEVNKIVSDDEIKFWLF